MPRAFGIGSIGGAAEALPAQFYLASTTRHLFPTALPTPYLPPTCPFGDIGGCQVYTHGVVSLLHFIPIGVNLSAFMNTFLDLPLVPSGFPSYPRPPLRVLGLPFISSGSPSYPQAPHRVLGLPFVSSGSPSYPRAPLRILGLPFISSGSPSCPRAPLHILGLPFVSSGPPSYPQAPLRILGLPFVSSGSPSCPRAPLHILGLPFVSPHSLIFLVSPDASPVVCALAHMPLDPSIISVPLWYMSMCF